MQRLLASTEAPDMLDWLSSQTETGLPKSGILSVTLKTNMCYSLAFLMLGPSEIFSTNRNYFLIRKNIGFYR